MDMLIIVLGVILTVLFFLHMRSAADVFCRIAGGFSLLLLYNAVAAQFSLPCVGINLLSSLTTGLLGLPGGILLICCAWLL